MHSSQKAIHFIKYLYVLFLDIVPASSPVRGREPSIATANNIDTLLGATETSEIVQPPESVQDKVHFIFNNISQTNLHQKVSFCSFCWNGLYFVVFSSFLFSWFVTYGHHISSVMTCFDLWLIMQASTLLALTSWSFANRGTSQNACYYHYYFGPLPPTTLALAALEYACEHENAQL